MFNNDMAIKTTNIIFTHVIDRGALLLFLDQVEVS